MSLKKNENIKRKMARRHLKQEENALLVSYKKALTNIDKDLAKYYKKYAVDDVLPKDRIRKAKQLKGLRKNVDTEIVKLHASENRIIGDNLAETYRHSYYRSAHALDTEVGADLGFSMVNPKAVEAVVANKMGLIKWADSSKANALLLSKRVKTQIEQGIIQGYSLQKTSKAVQKQMQIGAAKSIRIIRTETGRARSEGSLKAYDEADAEGLPLTRIWLATLDARTRDTHQSMDRQEADKNNLFHFPSGVVTRGPHLSGVAAEDVNCRCDIIVEIPEVDPSKFRAARDPVTGDTVNVKNMDFDEWAHLKKIKHHETVRVMAPEKLISKMEYVKLHKGEKSWRALYYDWNKLKVASGQKLTAAQLKFHNANFARYEATSVLPKGKVLVKPLTIPKPKPVVPPVEVKFSEGVLKTDQFAISEGWEVRHDAHKAALRHRMGFDPEKISMQKTNFNYDPTAEGKFKKAIESFTKPTAKTDMVSHVQMTLDRGGSETAFKRTLGQYSKVLDDIGGDNVIEHYNQKRIALDAYGPRGGVNYRANADPDHFIVRFGVRDSGRIQFHEYGHLLEEDRAVKMKARQWVHRRGHGKTVPLSDVSHYKDTERVYKNKFIDVYVGKIYESGQTEVLSVGMEQFTSTANMLRFAKKDFDHFSFVHGILTGAI